MDASTEHQELFVILQEIIWEITFVLMTFYREYRSYRSLAYLISISDDSCIKNLRMSRNAFERLCFLLENVGGLSSNKNVQVSEQVDIFLSILAHHKKNCVVKTNFKRSGYTISMLFNNVLSALLKLHTLFLMKPMRIEDDCTNERWNVLRVLKDALTREKSFRVPDEMPNDPLEAEILEVDEEISNDPDIAFIDQVEPSQHCHWSSGKASRRGWNAAEEKALENALKDLVVMGYKADNELKSGYQYLLEQAMKQTFLRTTLGAEPHINSRIHVWRKNYGSLSTMRSRSGFSWNITTNMITVESEFVWTNYIKDRATRENAEGFPDVVQQLLNENNNVVGGNYVPTFDNEQIDEVQSMSFSQANTSGSSKNGKRKRKVVDENDDRFIDLMSLFCDKTDDKLGEIYKRIRFEHDASLSRKAVFEAIEEVASLDMEEMISVSHLFINNTKNMDLFLVFLTMAGKQW
ncbi:hypothetical protein BUALT_Bualt07G0053200 [Buddleja alternifolia]|uniref:Myb/SANT-like domain-containing protein n=1 Tax=Buddleja alternifolia TaxID=168488 RepID=A0AAV6XF49_9LAMI|nr:hypothetical protein BUALT_Bualt07G0053200 [Buddleja alternifolia]